MFFLTTMGCLFPGRESVAMQKICATEIITFTLRDRGGVSQLTGRKEDIRKRVVPEKFASSVRFAVVRGLPCDVERLPLVELVLPVSDVGASRSFT